MRVLALGLAALALSACDSGTVPSPAERMNDPAAAVEADIDPGKVTLSSQGLTAGAERFYFAAGQTEVETALARALGKPGDTSANAECGAGPMESSTYSGALTVNFQNGNLVGWLWREDSDNVALGDDLAIGTARAEVENMPGFAMIEGSTLGEEFMVGDELAGFFEDGVVVMLYAGTQCFFR